MSTGGNVPQQGVVVQEATTQKKRGARGTLGKGTPGKRLKAGWRSAKKDSFKGSLRDYVRAQEKLGVEDALSWLASKGGGTPEQKSARRQRIRERRSNNLIAKQARKGKGKQQQKKSA